MSRLCLKQLVSACVHLSRAAGRVIRQTHKEGQLGAHNKKDGADTQEAKAMDAAEVLTIADLRAQHVIVSNIRTMFPGIRLVGEEDEADSKEEACKLGETQVVPLDAVPMLECMEVPTELAESLTLEDTCLWIDPLDGTIEFVRGNLQHVCVLIGITVKDRPVAGVVLEVFRTKNNPDGIVTYGAVGVGVFGDDKTVFGNAPDILIAGSEMKSSQHARVKEGLQRLKDGGAAEPVISQGAGQNILRVLRGQNSVFAAGPGASRWDTCACEALLMAVGGKITDLDGQPYQYTQGVPDYLNATGIIAARTENIHATVVDAMSVAGEPVEKRARTEQC